MTHRDRHRELKAGLLRASPFLLFLLAVFVLQKWTWLAEQGWVNERPPPQAADLVARAFLGHVLGIWVLAAAGIMVLLAPLTFFTLRLRLRGWRVRRLCRQLGECPTPSPDSTRSQDEAGDATETSSGRESER